MELIRRISGMKSANNATQSATDGAFPWGRALSGFWFHDLRHTFNTNARRAGIDRTVIMKLTGHKTLSMFNRYNTVDPTEGKEATLRLMEYLGKKGSKSASKLLQKAEKGLAKTA